MKDGSALPPSFLLECPWTTAMVNPKLQTGNLFATIKDVHIYYDMILPRFKYGIGTLTSSIYKKHTISNSKSYIM